MGSDASKTEGEPLATVTHARLRAAQGDAAAARRILEAILTASPGDEEALALLARLEGAPDASGTVEAEESIAPPQAGDPAILSARFRATLAGGRGPKGAHDVVVRFEAILGRIARERRSRHAR